jgi:hypothetical protein
VIFAGPTLDAATIRASLDADVRGPAARGDVLRAVEAGATAIGVIDGYFERVAAVWHKELLWALAKGLPVYGAASMGALRAAELAAFGMKPVGAIADAYLRDELSDDDEVAVAHRDADDGYAPVSEAMVNVRATLAAARGEAVITAATHDALVALLKGRFYAERSWGLAWSEGAKRGIPATELHALRQWLPGGRVDAKRADALALVAQMHAEAGVKWEAPTWRFEHTDAWEMLRRSVLQGYGGAPSPRVTPSPEIQG